MERRTQIILGSTLGVIAILTGTIALVLYYQKTSSQSTSAANPSSSTTNNTPSSTTPPSTSSITNPASYVAITNPAKAADSTTTTPSTTSTTTTPYAFTGKYKAQDNVISVKDNDYTCRLQPKNTGGTSRCILPLAEAEALCSSDNACIGYGQALGDSAWMAANNNGYQLASVLKGNWDHNWITFTKSSTIPVDAEIGAWSKWTDCVNNTQSETRPCIQDGKNGGITCASTTLTNSRTCTTAIPPSDYLYMNQVVPTSNSFKCTTNSQNTGGANYCILPLNEAINVCNNDITCKGYAAAIHNTGWNGNNPNMYQLFNSDSYGGNNDWESYRKVPAGTQQPSLPGPTSFVCHIAPTPYRWLLHGPSSDTSNMNGWSSGFIIKGFTQPVPHTTKYIVKYATNPTRMLFYKSDDESSRWGWGATDPSWGSGFAIYLYPNYQANTTKYYYQYASNPTRTCIATSDQTSAGWGFFDPNVGAGGIFYAPN